MNKTSRGKKKKEGRRKGNKKDNNTDEDQLYENMIVDENVTKDFEFLVKAPISEDDHFVFKSEKTWNVDVSKYSEYYLLNLNALSAAIETIPFHENVIIDKKYFTEDQLNTIHNDVERGKENYKEVLENLEKTDNTKTEGANGEGEFFDDTEENLDFLLSLVEPVAGSSTVVKPVCGLTSATPTTKRYMDLDEWLNAELED